MSSPVAPSSTAMHGSFRSHNTTYSPTSPHDRGGAAELSSIFTIKRSKKPSSSTASVTSSASKSNGSHVWERLNKQSNKNKLTSINGAEQGNFKNGGEISSCTKNYNVTTSPKIINNQFGSTSTSLNHDLGMMNRETAINMELQQEKNLNRLVNQMRRNSKQLTPASIISSSGQRRNSYGRRGSGLLPGLLSITTTSDQDISSNGSRNKKKKFLNIQTNHVGGSSSSKNASGGEVNNSTPKMDAGEKSIKGSTSKLIPLSPTSCHSSLQSSQSPNSRPMSKTMNQNKSPTTTKVDNAKMVDKDNEFSDPFYNTPNAHWILGNLTRYSQTSLSNASLSYLEDEGDENSNC